ncbi:cobalamin-independent methionine synthase II family protein [Methylomonas sp. UP202]|uniref:cobalamin-independent methionine synthase II family protein n=1 Tax=Methylomonas sp. UP202 TaxID=3040943 RepID=UPI00247902A4|nr:cobalamin-independent methionine synthase II family protein [Methylomonas sp. UP202]WGS87650.1 cobalamin-independent methionine synthase II family protein [Methylomonas sp. UP202]
MFIPTEPIGSIPRPPNLLACLREFHQGNVSAETLQAEYNAALRDTVQRFEATGSPVISDGEQSKPSFATYPLANLDNIAADGLTIPFSDGHSRQLPRLTAGPFRYGVYADRYLQAAMRYATVPVKQAVISASALSLLYPSEGFADYDEAKFLADLVDQAERDIRGCLESGAHCVQIDFTEGRLAVKLDPSKQLLRRFIELNNRVLERFQPELRRRIGVHTCPGGDCDSTHSADVDYAELLPELFNLKASNFYVQMASETYPERALAVIKQYLRPEQRVFVGVIDVLDSNVESPETVRDRVLQAAEFIPLGQLGTTDDCGYSPFEDDTSTGRDTAFAKIEARVLGTRMAAEKLGRRITS